MPTSIPYDPSLVLGNIVGPKKLETLTKISDLEAPVDAAEDELNSLISLERSLEMTIQELIDMKVDPAELITEKNDVGNQIKAAAVKYGKAKLDSEKAIQPLKATVRTINESWESPIDYNKTEIKQMALSSDTLKMNCQYFSNDSNQQNSDTHAATVAGFVSEQVSFFGDSYAMEAKTAVQSQMNSQHDHHEIAGTLVVSVICTHKNASVLAPFILDIDKAIRVWNKIYPDDMLKTNSAGSIAQAAAQLGTAQENSFNIISGATYGSSFVAMVHILNSTDTTSTENMYSIAESIQGQFEVSAWFVSESGGFGVDSSFSNDVKNLLSSQNISSHCTVFSMGCIPSIKSNTVKQAVQGFTDNDGAKSMAALSKLQGATVDDMTTVGSAATKARTGQQMISLQTAKVNAVLSGLAEIDNNNNKVIDTNSMMDALEDYVNKCMSGNVGVPINFYLKPISKSELAQAWLAKYYPNKSNLAGRADDSTPNAAPAANPATAN